MTNDASAWGQGWEGRGLGVRGGTHQNLELSFENFSTLPWAGLILETERTVVWGMAGIPCLGLTNRLPAGSKPWRPSPGGAQPHPGPEELPCRLPLCRKAALAPSSPCLSPHCLSATSCNRSPPPKRGSLFSPKKKNTIATHSKLK